MPSKNKKSKGKGKKAGKAAAKETADDAANEEQGKSLDSQMERLKIDDKQQADDDDALLEEAIKLASAEKKELEKKEKENCTHGYNPSPSEARFCEEFLQLFRSEYKAAEQRGDGPLGCLTAAFIAAAEKYPSMMCEKTNMECIQSRCLADGTKLILDGNYNQARLAATFAKYFEVFDGVIALQQPNTTANLSKMVELFYADEHTLVQFFRKKIPCSCLDERYKEVKSITKMGMCCNPQCPLPDRRAVRSKMVYCTRCCEVNYCSRECQVAAWPKHKHDCGNNS